MLLLSRADMAASAHLQLAHDIALYVPDQKLCAFAEARNETRTRDPFLTMEVLYQLSYPGGTLKRILDGGRRGVACSLEELARLELAVAELVVEDQVVGLPGVGFEADDHLRGAVLFALGQLPAGGFEQFRLGLDAFEPLG
jgi:hypothetical protein